MWHFHYFIFFLPDVGVHDRVILLHARGFDGAHLDDTGVVHEDVQSPELFYGVVHQPNGVGLFDQVGCNSPCKVLIFRESYGSLCLGQYLAQEGASSVLLPLLRPRIAPPSCGGCRNFCRLEPSQRPMRRRGWQWQPLFRNLPLKTRKGLP